MSGGLCIFWNNEINVEVYSWTNNLINANLRDKKGNKWISHFVYGNSTYSQRKKLWRELAANTEDPLTPQMFIGDFNNILSQEEKIGMYPKLVSQMIDFRNFVDYNGLMDLELQGRSLRGSLVTKCVRSASYKFKVNGELSQKVIPQRGLGQEDPLSPYLFIIAVEVFTIHMNEAHTNGVISGFKVTPTAPTVTHLLFADDCIILVEAKEEEIYQIILILNEYIEASGQRINLEKSGIIFGEEVSIQVRVNIEEILGIAAWDNPGKYLGLPTQ
ncbi:uncharacterized protein [Arachis hypogaea]|uniref:uncharacterized protein n=1 Tax=Arachis hypogaea TaxID=3818 RepID=UPI000DECFC57|nr:uncharacterized protein LOC112729968 [Arachis hypogaea]